MRDYRDAKAMAQTLRQALESRGMKLSVAESLELVARQFGFDNWNVLAARIAEADPPPKASATKLLEAVPVIRMFDVDKAIEFYTGFLGFHEDWRYTIFEGAPLYMQVSRNDVTLHLSEHHGDAAPGGTTLVRTRGIEALHAELLAKDYRYNRPGIEDTSYGARVMNAIDPFGNRLCFQQEIAE